MARQTDAPDLPPTPGRLRAKTRVEPFHVVLVEPEIPPNTGNAARLCGATCCPLHLVGKLGFRIDEHAVRRAGLDYWHLVQVAQHPTLADAEARIRAQAAALGRSSRTWLLSGKATRSYLDAGFAPGDALVFGKESVGLPDAVLEARPDRVIGIPTLGEVRSLNLANAVAIVLYEALRQIGALGVDAERR
ncbi:MAG TPA: tRNA (cytidine(34)-2'-O)-methyltransferase [Polyangiaceae bacterium]|nr:tRNA (cytidine(34)-2'-O)-methyltransferase [Polyangiaceae bacterium]